MQVERTATELRILEGMTLLAVHPLQLGKHQRQIIKGHRSERTNNTARPLVHSSDAVLNRTGDIVEQRELDVYAAIGASLAGEVLA